MANQTSTPFSVSTVRSTVESTAKSVADSVSSTASAVAESVTTYVHKGVDFADARLPELSYPSSLPTPSEIVDRASALVTSVAAKLPFVDGEAPADATEPAAAAKPVNATKTTKAAKTTKATKKSA